MTLMLGGIGGKRRRGLQRMRWLDGITDSLDMSLGDSEPKPSFCLAGWTALPTEPGEGLSESFNLVADSCKGSSFKASILGKTTLGMLFSSQRRVWLHLVACRSVMWEGTSWSLYCEVGCVPNGRGGWTPLRPLRGLQETRVATREESGALGFPSR